MKRELTIAGLMASVSGFAPETPCVAHIWVADDFEDIDSELSPHEVTEARGFNSVPLCGFRFDLRRRGPVRPPLDWDGTA